ncbi:MAG: uracil-DNA glycosylase [Tepidisphaera sp.]|nr:uracil-DNA glycosylase [Tepidisphaera sp.]
MDDARLARLVRQHAQTSRLMGVDFVPAFRRDADIAPDAIGGEAKVLTPEPERARATPPTPAPAKGAGRAKIEAEARSQVAPSAAIDAPTQVVEVKIDSGAAATAPGRTAAGSRDASKVQAALDALRARYEHEAPHKQFVTAHTRIVFGEGDPCARLVFVGEAPGEEEDRTGRPFVGRSGELLTKMIIAMGLSREQVYICNVMKTRPPDNATPTATEIAICEPYLREQLAIIAPEAIVTLGLPAARALLHTQESMTKMRGRWRTYELAPGHVVPLMPTFHPAYVLRNYTDETRGQVWSDLCQVLDKLGLPKPAKAKG